MEKEKEKVSFPFLGGPANLVTLFKDCTSKAHSNTFFSMSFGCVSGSFEHPQSALHEGTATATKSQVGPKKCAAMLVAPPTLPSRARHFLALVQHFFGSF